MCNHSQMGRCSCRTTLQGLCTGLSTTHLQFQWDLRLFDSIDSLMRLPTHGIRMA